MRKPIVRLALKKKTNDELLAFALSVVSNINGNANFGTPIPALAAITSAAGDFQTSIEAWGTEGNRGSHEDHETLVVNRRALVILLNICGGYVQSVADEAPSPEEAAAIIASSGMEQKSDPSPIGPLAAPADVRRVLKYTIAEGGLQIRWNKLRGADSYVVRRSDDGGATYTIAGYTTQSKFEDSGLTSGSQYTYTVAGIGAAGEGVISDPCVARAF
jgi:hypothetical protein